MMKNTLLGIILFTTTLIYGQKNSNQVIVNEKQLGKYVVDSSGIKGVEYVFDNRVEDYYLDTTFNYLTVQTRGVSKNGKWLDNTGNIIQYDLKNRRMLWTKKINYQTHSLQQFGQTIILGNVNKSYCIDIHTGKQLWEIKNNMYHVDAEEQIGVGYRFRNTTGFTNELEGIDLKNGNILWNREINREYGWNNIFYTNDSTIIIVAEGLHSVNLRTGKGWDYTTITGKKDYTGTIAANAAGVALGLLTGTFMMSTGSDLVRDLVSNTLVDSSSIYFASSERLAKINKETGAIVWQVPFQNELASKSSIFIQDNIIYMVNRGMAYMGYRQLAYGKPFIAAFNLQTGKQIYFSIMNFKDDPILSYRVNNGNIYLLFKNKICRYSLESGKLILSKDFSIDDVGEIKYFIGNSYFIRTTNGNLTNLKNYDSTKVYAFTSKRVVLLIAEDLTIGETLSDEELSVIYEQVAELKFVEANDTTFIMNQEEKVIAEIESTSKSVLIGNLLYDVRGNIVTAIDLSEVIEKNIQK